jgi:alkylresorcinol/alkylpyrone synthase
MPDTQCAQVVARYLAGETAINRRIQWNALPVLRSIATSVPPHVVAQDELQTVVEATLSAETAAHVGRVFQNARIDRRYLARPVDWYFEPHGHAERSQIYAEVGLDLAAAAAAEALQLAGLTATDVAAVVFVSTTGTSTPSLDARLCNRLGFSPEIRRIPIWGLGCAGGVAGLNRAAEMCQQLAAPVLMVAMELCSINLDIDKVLGGGEIKKATIAAALFGDGCAAAILAPDGDGPRHVDSHSHIFPDTEWVMGWTVTDRNLEVVLSPKIPDIVRAEIPKLVGPLLAKHGLERPDAWILHPGGARVIDAYQESLGLSADERVWTDNVLRNYGNMSSPTVLFCLRDYLAQAPPGQRLLLAALGPGFASEMALVDT